MLEDTPDVGEHSPGQIFRHLSNKLGIPGYWTFVHMHPTGGCIWTNVGEVTVLRTYATTSQRTCNYATDWGAS